MEIITRAAELKGRLAASGTIALVPTMGNLHEGHLELVRRARQCGDIVVTCIFVNRLEFCPNEDFDRYPRAPSSVIAPQLEAEGVGVVFAPGEREMYPVSADVSGGAAAVCR